MKIVRIEAVPFRLPLRRDFKWAGLAVSLGGFVLVRVWTDEGLVGLGEATPLPDWGGDHGRRGGETQRTVIAVIRDVLEPALVGLDPTRIEHARATMSRALRGHSYAKCAVEIALHDILGQVAGLPIYRLLGGGCRDAVPVAHMVGLMPNPEAIAEAEAAVADGIGALQIKGGVDPDRDVALIADLRRRLGDGVVLRLDANQGYRDAKFALSVLDRMVESRVDYVEQPVEGLEEMVAVTAAAKTRIVADESCWDSRDALEVTAARAADTISIYLAKAGGVRGAMQVAAIAQAAGLPCDVNGSIESAVGNAANLHVALAAAPVTMACVIPISAPRGMHPNRVGGAYYDDDIVTQPFDTAAGYLLPLGGPGLGVTLDEIKLARYREG